MRILLLILFSVFLASSIFAKPKYNLGTKTSSSSGEFGLKYVHVYNKTTTSNSFKENFDGIGLHIGKALVDNSGFQTYMGLNFENLWLGKERNKVDNYIYKTVSVANSIGPYIKVSIGNNFRIFGVASIGIINFTGKTISKLHPAYSNETIFWDDRKVNTIVTNTNYYKGLGFGIRIGWLELSVTNNSILPTKILDPGTIEMDNSGNLTSYSLSNSPNNIWMMSFTFSPIIH